MITILTAALGVFLLLTLWVSVDLLARKQLGERQHGCAHGQQGQHGHHHRHGGKECAGCQALWACQQDDDPPEPE